MRIDYDARTIACSVGDLIYDAGNRRLGVERGDGFRRMWIGQEIHSRRAEERASADPHYRPEVTVSHHRRVGDWTVSVSGRIDGLSVHDDRKLVEIEEVKSVHFELELAGLYRSEKLQRHLYQLMLYAYFLSLEEKYAAYQFLPQLVVIDLVTGNTRLIDAPFDREDVASALEASLEHLVDRSKRRSLCARPSPPSPRPGLSFRSPPAVSEGDDRFGRAHRSGKGSASRLRAHRRRKDDGGPLSGPAGIPAAGQEAFLSHAQNAAAGERGRRRWTCSTTARFACCAFAPSRRCARTRK